MTTKEFSDAFDTLLASYNHKAEFGDLASYADVTLDEYEKSVFLTLAQDNVIKSYFQRQSNSLAEGFDDSIRRLADFSSLITVWPCTRASTGNQINWSTGSSDFRNTTNNLTGSGDTYAGFSLIINFADDNTPSDSYTISNDMTGGVAVCTIKIGNNIAPSDVFTSISNASSDTSKIFNGVLTFQTGNSDGDNYLGIMGNTSPITDKCTLNLGSYPVGNSLAYDERGIIFTLPSNMLLMLNERVRASNGKFLVVVPISYKEYDRQMSRAYALPLKKQCWRLFEGEYASDVEHAINAEIIPKEGIQVSAYIVRYIRRPRPIILTDLNLTSSQEPLEIDGAQLVSECELNPILHMDILEEAVRLALNSKGIETRDLKAAREAAKRS